MPTPIDETPQYSNTLLNSLNQINQKTINADAFQTLFSDDIPTPNGLPTNSTYFNTVNNNIFSNIQQSNPFGNFLNNKAFKTVNCIFPSFTPPAIPTISNLFNINIFDQGIKQLSILPKTGGFPISTLGDSLLSTVKSFAASLLAPVTNFLGNISGCLKQD
jgi:hypothetical protein